MQIKNLKNILSANPKAIKAVYPKERTIEVFDKDYTFSEEDWGEAFEMIKKEIRTRPNPMHRIEYWECENIFGDFSARLFKNLLASRALLPAREQEKVNERALEQLLAVTKIPKHMGKLFLNELKLSTNEEDADLQNKARILGLM